MPSPLWEIQQGYIKTTYIPSKHQRAGIFTKALGIDQIQFLLNKLGILNVHALIWGEAPILGEVSRIFLETIQINHNLVT